MPTVLTVFCALLLFRHGARKYIHGLGGQYHACYTRIRVNVEHLRQCQYNSHCFILHVFLFIVFITGHLHGNFTQLHYS